MQDKKVVALIILVILAVISLTYGIIAPPTGKAKSIVANNSQVSIAPEQSSVKSIVSARRNARRSRFEVWKRNPFVSGKEALIATELTLNGIIWDKSNPKAMIGDAIVAKGDTIGANTVVDIQPDIVILNDGTKDFELKIEK